jgi:transketolase
MNDDLANRCINTVRVLAADAVQKANSGHPGTPMAIAPMGHVLWSDSMRYDPVHPNWPNRDRFILSAGHACLLQYILLHLTGYDVTMDDLKSFRQLHSRAAGHPEYGLLSGIEVTTGPLGQGFANGVGMAIAQKYLASRYNKPGYDLFNYRIFAICSDGDLMEGVTAEAASYAGNLQLGNLVYLYDDNHITIEGDTAITFAKEDTAKRFEAYGWHVQTLSDGNDVAAIEEAVKNACGETNRPSLIKIRTHIAYGSPNMVDKKEAHGAPLGEEEVKLVKINLGFDPEQYFVVPDEVAAYYQAAGKKGQPLERDWQALFSDYTEKYPELAHEYTSLSNGQLPDSWLKKIPTFEPTEKIATRSAFGKALNAVADDLPLMIGGAADLAPSTDTNLKKYTSFSSSDYGGRNFHFGIREHCMGAVLNGIAVTNKGFIPYGATFLIFSDYMRPPIRLASIMQLRTLLIYTHDSIGLGEDGTTHQPVEQLISLRSVPGITVIRPADANEAAEALRVAIQHTGGPVCLSLTRQKIPVIDQTKYAKAQALAFGAYILAEPESEPNVILIATGSEVHLALQAQEQLEQLGIAARVVSMPSWELFEKQSESYKQKILPPAIRKRVAIEAGSPIGWLKYVTEEGTVLGITKFGESAPGEEVLAEYGFTAKNIVNNVLHLLNKPETA